MSRYRGKHRYPRSAIWTDGTVIHHRLGGDVSKADIDRFRRALMVEKGWPLYFREAND